MSTPEAEGRWVARNKMILTSVTCAAAVGVIVLMESTLNRAGGPALPILWWFAYGLFILTLLAIHGWMPHPPGLTVNVLLAALTGLATLLALLFPEQVWMAMLFVMTATMASFFWPPRAVFAIIAAQSAMIVAMGLLGGWSIVEIVMATVGFGNFQVFGALVVYAVRGEAEARRDLVIAHAELRSTAALLEVTTREAERLRISRDLHDLAGHNLTALSLELEVAQHLTEGSPGNEHVRRAGSIAKDLLATVRTAVGEMRTRLPSLNVGLRELASDIPGLDISVRTEGTASIDTDRTIAILRCAQEAITNTLRHSSARHLEITVAAEPGGCRLTVSDDGDGADSIRPGHGLTGMRERFEALGGSLDLHSDRGAGFTVTGWLPGVIANADER